MTEYLLKIPMETMITRHHIPCTKNPLLYVFYRKSSSSTYFTMHGSILLACKHHILRATP